MMLKPVSHSVKFLFAGILGLILFSCGENNTIFEQYIEVKSAVWQKEDVAKFEFEIEDTSSSYSMYINIRNAGSYTYSNLYLFVTINGPESKLISETVDINLADKRGKWLGKGVGDLWDLQRPYRIVKFKQKGKYVISYEQAMRDENGVEGITDVGFRIDKEEEK